MTASWAKHPFVERIRAEREIVSLVNACRPVVEAELAGTSKKAVARWFERIPADVRDREAVGRLRDRLVEAGQTTKLAGNGSHRGAMLAEGVRRDAMEAAIDLVRAAAGNVVRPTPE